MAKKNSKTYLPPPLIQIIVLFSFLGLIYMMLRGISPHNSLPLISVSQIYGFMFLGSLPFVAYYFWKNKVSTTLSRSSQGLLAGMGLWTAILYLQEKYATNLSLTFPPQTVFSSIVGEIPPFYNFMMVNIWSPVIEELVFAIALPTAVILLFASMSPQFPILKNKVVQITAILLIAVPTFAYFHTSATGAFFVAAMMFRTIQVMLFTGDRMFDIVRKVTISFAFVTGLHIANNMYVFGLGKAYALLITEPEGMILLTIFGIMIIMAIRGLVVRGK